MGRARPARRCRNGAEQLTSAEGAVGASRGRLSGAALLAAALALPNATSLIGVVLTPQLLAHAPVLLLVLHPYVPVAALVLPEVAVPAFLVIAVLARLVPRYLAYLAGRSAGRSELDRYLARRPSSRFTRALPTSKRLMPAALLVVASAPVSALAGAFGVPVVRFLLLSSVGALIPTVALVTLGAAAPEPLSWVSSAITDNSGLWTWVLVIATAALGAVALLRRWRRG
jgi:membrane protein DedA with SNARE-associated domain